MGKNSYLDDLFGRVTGRLLEKMEEGCAPWVGAWHTKPSAKNAHSNLPYRGFNQLALTVLGEKYFSPYWMTYNQTADLGGSVKKGEKGTMICFWQSADRGGNEPETDGDRADGTGQPAKRKHPVFKYFHVFNYEQTSGVNMIHDPYPVKMVDHAKQSPHDRAAEILRLMAVCPIEHADTRPGYRPGDDLIVMPPPGRFDSLDRYYLTAFHEAVHATGHSSRLKRFDEKDSSSYLDLSRYSREELVAQMAAAYLGSAAGLDEKAINDASVPYLKQWLKVCRDEPGLLITAANRAQKATEWILGISPEVEAYQQSRGVQANSPSFLAPRLVEQSGNGGPDYVVSGRRNLRVGDLVRHETAGLPGSPDLMAHVAIVTNIESLQDGLVEIDGRYRTRRENVKGPASFDEARSACLEVGSPVASSLDDAKKWIQRLPHLALEITAGENGVFIARKPPDIPVTGVALARENVAELFIDEPPAFRHAGTGDLFLGHLETMEGRADLYFARSPDGPAVLARYSSLPDDVAFAASPNVERPELAIAQHRAKKLNHFGSEFAPSLLLEAVAAPEIGAAS